MNKSITLLGFIVILNLSFGQNIPTVKSRNAHLSTRESVSLEKGITIWQSDFSDSTEWQIDADTTQSAVQWQIGSVSCAGNFPIEDIHTDGPWALLDSDANAGTGHENAWLTTSNAIDFSAFPNALVEFNSFYRKYSYDRPYLVVGVGDGSGPSSVVWPDLNPNTDITSMNNVFDVFPNMNNGDITFNWETIQIDISSALEGLTALQLSDVYLRLNWTGIWGYAWFVDDFRVVEQVANDLSLKEVRFTGEHNDGINYYQYPIEHLDSNWIMGGEYQNIGVNTQTNVNLNLDFNSGLFVRNYLDDSLVSNGVTSVDSLEFWLTTAGAYSGVVTLSSDQEFLGPDFANNVDTIKFKVNDGPQSLYAIDGIDVLDDASLNLLGTGTASFMEGFPGAESKTILANKFILKVDDKISGAQVLLDTANTVSGGFVRAFVVSQEDWLAGELSDLYSSDFMPVTDLDIINGYMNLYFSTAEDLDSGVYYLCTELSSDGGQFHISVLDDRTYVQPDNASMVHLSGGYLLNNGNAFAIRMMMGDDWEASLNSTDYSSVKVYPNPAKGTIKIQGLDTIDYEIEVRDFNGRSVYNEQYYSGKDIDIDQLESGVYFLVIKTTDKTMYKQFVKQ